MVPPYTETSYPTTGNDWGGIPRDTCFSNWRTFGLTKTLGRLRLKYYWVGMAADLRLHLRQCDVCARRKCPSKTLRFNREDKSVADEKGSAGCGWSIPPHLHGKSAREGLDESRAACRRQKQ